MKYLVWIITIFLNVTGHHFLPMETRRSGASLNNYTGYETSHCQYLRVILKNNTLASQSSKQGTYNISKTINDKPSWTSESHAIWFIPQWNQWAIGPIDSLGTTNRGIGSSQYNKDPQNVVSWDYLKEGGWLSADDDIIVKCISFDMKYAILTGYPGNDETAQMEVMDESGSTKICNSKSKYPLKVSHATGVLHYNYIIVCGGISPPTTPACYAYGYTYPDNQKVWTRLADMDTPRYGSASVSIDDGILVTGGLDDGRNTLKTSEIVFLNRTKKQGKPLPEPRSGHCLVEYQGQIISTGGIDGNDDRTSTVWSFNNHEEFTMTNKPSMIHRRALHACGIVHSSLHDGRPLLVVAGAYQGSGRDKSEFWDFSVPGSQWQSCSEDLPVRMHEPQMTHTTNKKGLLMTYRKGIYSFQCRSSNDCYWTKESYELETSRRAPVMIMVPSSLVENC